MREAVLCNWRCRKPFCSVKFSAGKRGSGHGHVRCSEWWWRRSWDPTLGGWLTDTYSWRWAFYINVPIGVLAVFMIWRFVKDPPYIKSAHVGRFDSIGLGLLAIWLGAMQLILDKGQEDDWFGSERIRWACADLRVAGFVVFLLVELRKQQPIVDLKVFKDRNFAMGCLFISLLGAVIYGIVSILPLFYQTVIADMHGGRGRDRRESQGNWSRAGHAARRSVDQPDGQPVADRRWIHSVCVGQLGDVRADFGYFKMVVAMARDSERLGCRYGVCSFIHHRDGHAQQ